MTRLMLFLLALAVSASSAFAGTINRYTLDRTIGAGTVTGWIETDGTIGVLTVANITDYELTISAPNLGMGPTTVLTPANQGQLLIFGDAVVASADNLSYDFGDANGDLFLIQGNAGANSNFWCLESLIGGCTSAGQGENIGFSDAGANVAQSRSPVPTTVEVFATRAMRTYIINREVGDDGAVSGTITTDGTIGVLAQENILDWDLDLDAPGMEGGPTDSIDFPTSFQTLISGTGTTATTTELRFDFGAASGFFLMQGFTAGGDPFGNFYCIEVDGCTSGGVGEHIGQAADGGNVAQTTPGSGVVTFATVAGPDPITYTINREVADGRIWGTITTNGRFGVMRSSNIIDWDLTLCAPNLDGGPVTRITSDSQIQTNLAGDTTIASSTDLMFDISQGDLGEGFFLLQGTEGTLGNFYCIETSGCTGDGLGEHIGYVAGLGGVSAQTGLPSGFFSFATINPDDITYQIDRTIGNGSVSGWITLDGTMGTLSGNTNIVDFELTVDGPNLSGGPAQVFTPATVSQARFQGDMASATPTEILFDILGASGEGFFVTQSSFTGDFWCVETELGGCTGLGEGEYIGFDIGGGTASEMASPTGTFALGTVQQGITYQVNRRIGAGTVTGFITTDGTIGTLLDSNIIDWDLALEATNLENGPVQVINPGNTQQLVTTGTNVTATSTGIFFDISGGSGEGYLLFQNNTGGSGFGAFWCLETQNAVCTGLGAGEYIGFADTGATAAQSAFPSGNFRVATNCPADINGDGDLDFFDVSAFLQALANNNPIADFTGDGMYDFFDVSAFLQALSAGCPTDPC